MRRGMLVVPVMLVLSGVLVHALGQVAKLDGTSTTQFVIRANGTSPTTMQAGDDGELVLPNGLTVSGGTITFYGAAVSDLSSVTTCDINGGSIDGVTIGGAVAPTVTNLGTVTTCDINGGTIDGVTIGGSAAPTVTNLGTVTTCDINGGTIDGVTIGGAAAPTVTNLGTVTTCDINGGTIDGTSIGASSASSGKFTTISASGQITSTVANGTAPFVVASATEVAWLSAQYWGPYDVLTRDANYNGGVFYQGSPSLVSSNTTGTAGQFLTSAGQSAPTWTGLTTGYIWVGQSNLPVAVAVSGDINLSTAGVATIQMDAISGGELASGSVTEAKIGSGAVTEAKIGSGAVTEAKIGSGAVTEGKIGSGAVTAGKLPSALQDGILLASTSISCVGDNCSATLTVTDAAGNALTRPAFVSWVVSDSQWSATVTGESVTTEIEGGSAFADITANKKGEAFSASNGIFILSVTLVGDHTVYAHFGVGGQVYVQALDFD